MKSHAWVECIASNLHLRISFCREVSPVPIGHVWLLSQLLCNPSATPIVFYLVKGKQDLWPLTSFPFSRLSCLPSEFISLSLYNIKGKEQEQREGCVAAHPCSLDKDHIQIECRII